MSPLVDLTIRSSAVVLVGLLISALLRDRSAALRHFVLAATVFAAAAVVPLSQLLPGWDVPLPSAATYSAEADAAPAAATAPADEPPTGPSGGLLPLAGLVWAAGFVVAAAGLLAGFVRLAWIAGRAERVQDGRWKRIAEQVSAAYGLSRTVTVLQTAAPGLLAAWGLFRPRVLLPAGAQHWSEERVLVVLCHELAHIRRHDWFVQLSAEALRTVCWFNPLFWMLCRRLRHESEQACDDAVLDAGVPGREYARHLLEIARRCRRSGPAWAPAVPMVRLSMLERRIAAMLNTGLDRQRLSRRAIAVTTILILGITLPVAALRAGQDGPRPLAGSIYDPSGAVLPGVELTLEDAQEFTWQATTDAAGRFEFPPVQPGRYVLEASLAGFRPLRHEFELRSARDWDRAVTLQVGNLRETISVRERRVAGPSAASQEDGPRPVRVGGNLRAPRKIRDVKPVYPAAMRDAGREGSVPLEAIIGQDGATHSVRVLGAHVHPDFAIAAVDAVRQWQFNPTLLNGVPVEVVMTVTVDFSLAD